MLATDALHAEIDEECRHEDRPDHPVQDRVHATVQRARAKAIQPNARIRARGDVAGLDRRRGLLDMGLLHLLQYTAPDRLVTVDARVPGPRAGVAQLVERLSCKQGVSGSSPLSGSQGKPRSGGVFTFRRSLDALGRFLESLLGSDGPSQSV